MLFNDTKIILDLCGGTGAWSDPYRSAGYDVRLITLPEQDVTVYIPPKDVYGILAAPPCTMFSKARNSYSVTHPRDFVAGMGPVNACIRIIWQCKPVFWALENPVALLMRWLGRPRYIFEPWWFDEPWSKRTGIWGNFDFPIRKFYNYSDNPKTSTVRPWPTKSLALRKSGIPTISDITSGRHKGQENVKRSITPSGFARAFFEENQ